jgi:hypothetical protein
MSRIAGLTRIGEDSAEHAYCTCARPDPAAHDGAPPLASLPVGLRPAALDRWRLRSIIGQSNSRAAGFPVLVERDLSVERQIGWTWLLSLLSELEMPRNRPSGREH